MGTLPRLFLSRPLPEPALGLLAGKVELSAGPATGAVTRESFLAGAQDADAVVSLLSDRIDAELFARCPRLKVVSNYAVGFNNMDLAAADAAGVWLTNTPDVVTDATAECAFGLMLAAARRIPEAEQALRAGRWEGWTPTHFLGLQLEGATLGIVGLGRIGRAVASRALAFKMKVIAADPHRSPELEAQGIEPVGFEELLRRSDVVTLHCPLLPETRHLVDARALSLMKPGAILVNTARGPIVDEGALAEALHAGKLGAAGLDVYEEEPRVHPRLLSAPRAVLAPHLGTSTVRTRLAQAEKALGDVLLVLAGGPPRNPVNRPPSPRR
ncbi:MAG TPA: D-glycerate dehydrogenase [Myxococcales bacterium]|jgi:glyoxylate reductase